MFEKIPNKNLNRLTKEECINFENKTPLIIILDNVRSLNNIGSIFRTADAFLIEKIILCGITATPPHKDIFKTALGATETVSWEYEKDISEAIKKLKEKDYKIFAVEQTKNSITLNEFLPEKENKFALILGNEIDGVNQTAINFCDGVIEVPQFGSKHSLNISVCAGIVIWDIFSKLRL